MPPTLTRLAIAIAFLSSFSLFLVAFQVSTFDTCKACQMIDHGIDSSNTIYIWEQKSQPATERTAFDQLNLITNFSVSIVAYPTIAHRDDPVFLRSQLRESLKPHTKIKLHGHRQAHVLIGRALQMSLPECWS
jgi:hypothetical protein